MNCPYCKHQMLGPLRIILSHPWSRFRCKHCSRVSTYSNRSRGIDIKGILIFFFVVAVAVEFLQKEVAIVFAAIIFMGLSYFNKMDAGLVKFKTKS